LEPLASSSLELFASFRVLNDLQPASCPSNSLATTQEQEAPSFGFVPHRDINQRRPPSTPGYLPTRAQVPSATFRASSTVCSATSLAGLFHPAATSRVCPSGVCPSPRSRTGFPRPIHALLSLE